MASSSNGQDTRFSSLQYRFDSRWCFQWFIRIMVSISDCLSEDRGSIPLWTAMKINMKM